MNTFFFIGTLILFAIVVLVIFNLLKIFVLSKLNVNKWIVLALAIISFIISLFGGTLNNYFTLIFSGIFLIFMMWFIDLMQYNSNSKKEKKIKIKPKAKPNRIKHTKNKN